MIKTEPWTGGSDEEYETQHFGFGSQRLKIAVRQLVEQKIRNVVKDMETYLQAALDLNEIDKSTLTRSCNKLIRLYCEGAGPSLDVVDSEIERLLTIPPNVLLPGDENQLEVLSDEQYSRLKDEVAFLRQRVVRGSLMEALLTSEEEELASLENVCEVARKDMETVDLLHKSSDAELNLLKIQSEIQFLQASVPVLDKDDDILKVCNQYV